MVLLRDDQLIQAVRRRDGDAFDAIMRRHGPAVRNRLLGIVRRQAAAEDLLQEVFLRLWTHADQYGGSGSLRGCCYCPCPCL